MEVEQWRRMLAIHVGGTYNTCAAVLPGMLEAGWGSIVTIGSEEALSEGFYDAHYVAAKGAIFGLTKSLAVEFARERGDVRFSWADRLAETVLRDDR